MIATLSSLKTATEYDIDRIADSMALAFSSDPIARWMYPEPKQYLQNFPNFVKAFGGKAVTCETAYYIDNYSGAALWFPPDIYPDTEGVVALIEQTVPESDREDLFAMLEAMGNYHPSEPHWYLAVLGVEPFHQRKGYGSALLENVLEQCDRNNQIAYLESSKPSNLPFYKRHGFEVLGEIQVGMSPPLFPMLRIPR